ncbi:MAG: bifunctional glutamine synthetase adenylyltransferase/deadenyltransferase, partial [Actinomycetota bacterium]
MPTIDDLLPASRYLSRLFQARPALRDTIEQCWQRPPKEEDLRAWLAAEAPTEDTLKPVLRRFKQWAYAWIALRDLGELAPLAEVTGVLSLIAELAVQTAQTVLTQSLVARYGTPRNADGAVQDMIVIGMGKLGGRELNVSSDIDLIFVYPEDGDTDGEKSGLKSISNFDFFTRLGRQLINAIADVTEDGQVFR